MIAKAWGWAKANQKVRVNPIHGEEEIHILVNETFDFKSTDFESAGTSGSFQVEDP